MFETYQRASSIADRRRELASTFIPVLVVTLIALALLMVPIAWILATPRRAAIEVADAARDRVLGSRARRIADLHDGPVELAGLSMRLSAGRTGRRRHARPGASRVRLGGAAACARPAVVGVYPPNRAGRARRLAVGHGGATAARSVAITLDDAAETFGVEVDALLYRACQEAVRNVEEHADAGSVRMSVRRADDSAVLEVEDDGRGIEPERVDRARQEGHVGLSILSDLVADGGGRLSVHPRSSGTVVRVEVPIP